MACKFDINDLQTSLSNLEEDVMNRLPHLADLGLDNETIKKEVLREISEISDDHQIDSSSVDLAIEVFNNGIADYFEEFPSKEEIRNAMLAWTIKLNPEQEDTSSEKLNNKERSSQLIVEDPLGVAYDRALKAKLRAQQHANSVGVHSILFNNDGIIDGTHELNNAIRIQQEELLQTILRYIASNVQDFEYSDAKMYENGWLSSGKKR